MFAQQQTGASLEHVSSYSFDPAVLSGKTVLCGELSLGSAIVAEEWVEAYDIFGRNR